MTDSLGNKELKGSVDRYLADELENRRVEGYWQLLEPEQAVFVSEIAKNNWPYYQNEFNDNYGKFSENVAKNWLGSYQFFIGLMEKNGYLPPSSGEKASTRWVDERQVAILTINSSVVLLGKGAINSKEGVALKYIRIPLRRGEIVAQNIQGGLSFDKGARIFEIPTIGQKLTIHTPRLDICPTPLLVYYQSLDSKKNVPFETMAEAFTAFPT